MDPWQQTVETRLGDLRDDLRALTGEVRALTSEVGAVKVDVATIKERITHLPTKGFIVSALLSSLAVIAALTAFAPEMQRLLGQAH